MISDGLEYDDVVKGKLEIWVLKKKQFFFLSNEKLFNVCVTINFPLLSMCMSNRRFVEQREEKMYCKRITVLGFNWHEIQLLNRRIVEKKEDFFLLCPTVIYRIVWIPNELVCAFFLFQNRFFPRIHMAKKKTSFEIFTACVIFNKFYKHWKKNLIITEKDFVAKPMQTQQKKFDSKWWQIFNFCLVTIFEHLSFFF